MKKPELVNKIFKELNYYTKQDIDEGTTAILELISESLQNRDRIEIRGFGNFTVKHLLGKEARNPKTNEKVWVKERFVPKFKVSKLLIDSVNKSQLKGF